VDSFFLRGILLIVVAYMVGSIPFGVIVSRAFDRNVDLRKVGSGNIGATNVARALGKWAGILTLLLDVGKAVFVLAIARFSIGASAHAWLALVGGAAFLGHVFPIYLRFKGGKGVATALGVVAFLSPVAGLALLVMFAVAICLTRYVSFSSLFAAAGLPVVMALLDSPPSHLGLSFLITVVVFVMHRQNIRRLLAGQEPRIGASLKNSSL
jgi:glycerol-3-phosphate acyltransferase PlsY